jgi:hypothetical protein
MIPYLSGARSGTEPHHRLMHRPDRSLHAEPAGPIQPRDVSRRLSCRPACTTVPSAIRCGAKVPPSLQRRAKCAGTFPSALTAHRKPRSRRVIPARCGVSAAPHGPGPHACPSFPPAPRAGLESLAAVEVGGIVRGLQQGPQDLPEFRSLRLAAFGKANELGSVYCRRHGCPAAVPGYRHRRTGAKGGCRRATGASALRAPVPGAAPATTAEPSVTPGHGVSARCLRKVCCSSATYSCSQKKMSSSDASAAATGGEGTTACTRAAPSIP